MKKLQKNNKGFSLVELIIVIAIMAVLMTVLAPQFLRYVERSRLQSDNTTLGEIANVCKIAATNEDIATAVTNAGTTGITVTIAVAPNPAAVPTSGDTNLNTELTATIGAVALSSNTYAAGTAPTILLRVNANNVIEVSATNYIPTVDDAATPEANHVF